MDTRFSRAGGTGTALAYTPTPTFGAWLNRPQSRRSARQGVDGPARIVTRHMSRIAKASLLLFFFSLCAAAFVVSHQLEARRPPPAPHDLFAVVNGQLAAFRAADFSGAYRHAALGVQQKFTIRQFEAMVRQHYTAMTQAHRVEFGQVKTEGGNAVVQVFFFGEDRTVRSFLYSLVSEGDGWKIEGVQEVRAYRSGIPLAGSHA